MTKVKEYGTQLREKQKMRRIYGVREGQFRGYFQEAMRRRGVTGEILVQLVELRLDNVVYRLGFAASRAQARELSSHRHFMVNGQRVNTPSYMVRPGDVIEVQEKSKGIVPIVEAIQGAAGSKIPAWLEVYPDKRQGKIVHLPLRNEVDTEVDETLIVEFYSR
jgi:small subunit ribosomal protein S4